MFKIGINSAPRIVPAEVTETQESSSQQIVQEQIAPPATKQVSAANSSIRSEAMFSSIAMRTQLTQQLARNESMQINPASLQHSEQVDRQAPLTQADAEQQIDNQPTYVEPFSADEASKGALLPKTLYTGDGDDHVDIQYNYEDKRVQVNVNGKEAWSGTEEQFQALTIDTGKGNDTVTNNMRRANIVTGEGDDVVTNRHAITSFYDGSTIDTGSGNDIVTDHSGYATIVTGDGDDKVTEYSDYSQIDTGSGSDIVTVNGRVNTINTGSENDSVHILSNAGQNRVNTGSGDDTVQVDEEAHHNTIETEGGNDFVRLNKDSKVNTVLTGEGDDVVVNEGFYNDVDGVGNPFKRWK